MNGRKRRLENLRKVPLFAAVDHRFFLDENGEDTRLKALPRKKRRELAAGGRKIGAQYIQIIRSIKKSGVGYPVDQILRDFAIEYTHRYAKSGVMNQPASFNYIEAFCAIKLIKDSVAPYAEPAHETDHLFNVADFFDYLTAEDTPTPNVSDLQALPEGRIYHFTQNGSINEFTYMTAEGREFVVSGFSIIRHGNSVHWYVLGGEILSEAEWQARSQNDEKFEIQFLAPEKRRFFEESMDENGDHPGAPIALEGTKTAIRTVIAGETDLTTAKHVGRCYMSETQHSFMLVCDDPETFANISDQKARQDIITAMRERVESAAVMWNLAEGFFQLPKYFQFRVTVPEAAVKASGKQAPKTIKGGRGVGTQFKHVTSIEISDIKESVLRSYTSPHLEVETDGYWRHLPHDQYGQDRDGNSIKGRTWIKARHEWRARSDQHRTVYIKSSVATAKIQVSDYLAAAQHAAENQQHSSEKRGVLYVMRCLAMKNEVYKVGWTSNTAEQRARELSSVTGVPLSFTVVEVWEHPDPGALEKGVHALLTPYRLNESREFFSLKYPELKTIIETEIARTHRHKTSS